MKLPTIHRYPRVRRSPEGFVVAAVATGGVVHRLVGRGGVCVTALLLFLLLSDRVHAGEHAPITAAAGLGEATAAAAAWAADAELVYVENDEPVDGSGAAPRWGYLFRSPTQGRSRGYSVEGGRVVEAADLEVRFEAPPLGTWIDSARALQAAEEKQGAKFRTESQGRLAHMVLVRSAGAPDEPERTSWLVIYRAEGAPALFVLVDAKSGAVDRTWRG